MQLTQQFVMLAYTAVCGADVQLQWNQLQAFPPPPADATSSVEMTYWKMAELNSCFQT